MKKFILILFVVLPIFLNAQNSAKDFELQKIFPIKDGKIYYTEIIEISDSISTDVIFLNLKSAIISSIQSSANIIQSEDLNNGSILAKGYIVNGHNSYIKDPKIWFSFKVDIKDNKYRYVLTNVIYDFSVTVSTNIYANTINTHQNTNKPFEEWLKPEKGFNKRTQKSLEKWLLDVDSEFKNIIEQIKIKALNKDLEW